MDHPNLLEHARTVDRAVQEVYAKYQGAEAIEQTEGWLEEVCLLNWRRDFLPHFELLSTFQEELRANAGRIGYAYVHITGLGSPRTGAYVFEIEGQLVPTDIRHIDGTSWTNPNGIEVGLGIKIGPEALFFDEHENHWGHIVSDAEGVLRYDKGSHWGHLVSGKGRVLKFGRDSWSILKQYEPEEFSIAPMPHEMCSEKGATLASIRLGDAAEKDMTRLLRDTGYEPGMDLTEYFRSTKGVLKRPIRADVRSLFR